MFRVHLSLIVAAALGALNAGCARAPEPHPPVPEITKTVVKVVEREKAGPVVRIPQCPSDAEIADAVVITFADIYPKVPGGTRTCPCPDSTYVHYGKERSCSSGGAIHPATWARPYCSRDTVSPELIAEIKSKIAACRTKQ